MGCLEASPDGARQAVDCPQPGMGQRQPAEEGPVGQVGAGFEVLAVGDGLVAAPNE